MNSYWGAHALAQKVIETTESLKICYIFNVNHISFKTICQRSGMAHQQRVSHSGLLVIECVVGKSCQSP